MEAIKSTVGLIDPVRGHYCVRINGKDEFVMQLESRMHNGTCGNIIFNQPESGMVYVKELVFPECDKIQTPGIDLIDDEPNERIKDKYGAKQVYDACISQAEKDGIHTMWV